MVQKLDPEFKIQWLSALRSGKYKQGHGGLRSRNWTDVDYFCCLGVACDIFDPTAWKLVDDPEAMISDYQDTAAEWGWDGIAFDQVHLPFLDNVNYLTVATYTAPQYLANMNDQEDADFDQIADWIEANL